MDLTKFLNIPRSRPGCGFTTLTPPQGAPSTNRPDVRAAVRAVVANTATPDDINLLRRHWMVV